MASAQDTSIGEAVEREKQTTAIRDGVQWSAGFCRTWIHRSLADLPPFEQESQGKVVQKARITVKAVFYRSFIESVFKAHENVSAALEDQIITAQLGKYGHQISRVNDAMYGYWRDGFLSPLPDLALSEAWQIYSAGVNDGWTGDDLVSVTEEIYEGDFGIRHHFTVEAASQPITQDVLVFTAQNWRSLDIGNITYHDYFLTCDEERYTTLLDFLARLHVISSPNYVAVAPDGRLFLADSLEMLYSPTDATRDAPARSQFVEIVRYLLEHSELTKDMQPVIIRGPNNISDATYLVTQTQLRKVMQALKRQFMDWDSPLLSLPRTDRLEKYMASQFPNIFKAAMDLAINACGKKALTSAEAEAEHQPDSNFEGSRRSPTAFEVRFSGHTFSNPRHVIYDGHRTRDPKGLDGLDEYVICSIRASIGSDRCGCDLYHQWSDSHVVGFDFIVRGDEASNHANAMCLNIKQLFVGDLIMNEGGRQNAEPILSTASDIMYRLRELDLIQDDNFDQETLSIVALESQPRKVWPLLAAVWKGKPLIELHNYLIEPIGQGSFRDQGAEITISKLVAVCITCCVTAIIHEAQFWKGREASILTHPTFFKYATLNVPEASMVVNLVLKALDLADPPLLQAVLGTVSETYNNLTLGTAFKSAVDRHPLIASCTPDMVNRRTSPECSCVICVTVATTQLNGTWRRDLLRDHYFNNRYASTLLRSPMAGAMDLVASLTNPRRMFLSMRNSNYVLHNAPQPYQTEDQYGVSMHGNAWVVQPLPHEEERLLQNYTTQFDNDNDAPGSVLDETIEAFWDSSNRAAVDRVRSAMIIGSQSTKIDMNDFDSFGAEKAPDSPDGSQLRQAKFKFPGWLCEMIVREAHGHVPAGTAHWAAVRSIDLAQVPISQGSEEQTSTPLTTQIPSKRSIFQPHPLYNWPLSQVPQPHDIVLLDLEEKRRICIPLSDLPNLAPKPVFASHVWETKSHPDPTGRQISRILEWKDTRYLWLDYACLPQGPRTKDEQTRFKNTLHGLSALQSLMTTKRINDAHDKREWEQRGWTIIEALIGKVPSPFSQAVYRYFRANDSLAGIFSRLRISVTNQTDIAVLEMVLRQWTKTDADMTKTIRNKGIHVLPSTSFPLVKGVGLLPPHQELAAMRKAEQAKRDEVESLFRTLRLAQAQSSLPEDSMTDLISILLGRE